MIVTSASSAAIPDDALTQPVRMLCWTYRREDELVECQLGLNTEHSGYELRIQPPCNAFGSTVEVFDDAIAAFQRHATIERILIHDGWSLEGFESAEMLTR